MNFTLVVSEKSSLICCGQSTLIHTYPSLDMALGKRLSTSENLEFWGQSIGFKTPCWYGPQSSLCLQTVLSFLASQGKKRARDLKTVCGNLGKSTVSQRIDISSYLTKVFWLSARYFRSLVTVLHVQFNCLSTKAARAKKSPWKHWGFPSVLKEPSDRDAPDNQRPSALQNFSTLENLSPASHAAPNKIATSYMAVWFPRDSPHSQNTQEKWPGH